MLDKICAAVVVLDGVVIAENTFRDATAGRDQKINRCKNALRSLFTVSLPA
jgi:hypothetical protein